MLVSTIEVDRRNYYWDRNNDDKYLVIDIRLELTNWNFRSKDKDVDEYDGDDG